MMLMLMMITILVNVIASSLYLFTAYACFR